MNLSAQNEWFNQWRVYMQVVPTDCCKLFNANGPLFKHSILERSNSILVD